MRGKRFVRHHANADPLGNHPHQCSLIVYLQLGGDGEPQEPRLFKHKSLHGTGIIERDPSGFGFQYVLEESFLYRSQRMVLRCHDDESFCNEAGVDFHGCLYAVNQLDGVKHRYPAIPCYIIMDEAGRLAGRPTHFKYGYTSGVEGYYWSEDSSKEIESGIVKRAQTLDELAKMINVPAGTVKAQVAKWNADMKAGADSEFGRKITDQLHTNIDYASKRTVGSKDFKSASSHGSRLKARIDFRT